MFGDQGEGAVAALRGFLNFVIAGATAGGIFGGIVAAYRFIDDSMKPTQD